MTMRLLLVPVLLVAAVGTAGCGEDEDTTAATTAPPARSAAPASFATVTAAQIAPRVAAGEVLLVDVREQAEWDAGRAPKAVHVPLGEVQARLAEIRDAAAGRPVVFVCRSGNRSAQAARIAVDGGLDDVSHVGGGMGSWASAGLPLRPPGGRVL